MFSTVTYQTRRKSLADLVQKGIILLPGNGDAAMNYRGNDYPFRQDSNFRYFAGHDRPDLVLTIDAETGESRLYGNDLTLDDVVWMGAQPSVKELAEDIGARHGGDLAAIHGQLKKARSVHFLPPYRQSRRYQLQEWLGEGLPPSKTLIQAVVKLREEKSAEEIAEMDQAVKISMEMHGAARAGAKAGMKEAEVAGMIEGMAISAGGRLAYPAIVTKNGHILHNHYHGNVLQPGDLLLIDAGAQTSSGYAGDITRTFSVAAEMTEKQQAVYDIVEEAKRRVIERVKPGVPNRELHDFSARLIVDGLKRIGLMKGNTDDAVERGAHAMFYPHGLGHLIGLDVHDMEDLGEDLVGYDDEFKRSTLFGTRNLRLGRRLKENFAITVEPGIYFIPALIDKWKGEELHAEYIDFAAVEEYRDFGGIRLEDNVVVTADNCKVIGSV